MKGRRINKFKIFMLLCLSVLIISLSTKVAYAQDINVALPTFDVTMNGAKIENEYRKYPFIVYKDITYYPMTYFDSRFLGLETKWDNINGLEVINPENMESYGYYETDLQSAKNFNRYRASIPKFNIIVNGKKIDNSKETYPLIIFRDITYFPLTWRFAADEFNWDYIFTNENGLEINNPKYSGPQITEVDLPIAPRDGGDVTGAFTAAGNYFYYEGDDGKIYQVPIEKGGQIKAVYELPLWTYGSSFVYAGLETIDGSAVLSYHQGGAMMGTDYKIILHEDGTNETFSEGYCNKKVFGDVTVYVSQGVPPGQNNLSIKKISDEEFNPIGNSDYIYGWIWSRSGEGSGGGMSNDLYMIGDDIYVLAYYKPQEENGTTGIHKVNIVTGETTRLCDESAKKFYILNDVIYFMDMDGYLYKLQLGQNIAAKLLDYPVSDFVVLNHQIYYVSNDGLELFKLGESTSANPGGIVKSLNIQDGYVACTFESYGSSPIKLIIFNDEGNAVFKTSSIYSHLIINNDRIFYIKK